MLLIMIYTFVEYFISTNNLVMDQALSVMNTTQVYDRSSAMLWFYLVVAGLIIGGAIFLYNRICLRKGNLCLLIVICSAISLVFGILGARFGARAGAKFAENLRERI